MFRDAVPPDVNPLKNLAKRVIKANYAPLLGEDAVAAHIDSGAADREIDNALDSTVVMSLADAIIGFAIVRADVLHLIMIAPELQGMGYGSRLLAHVEPRMFTKYPRITLQSFKSNIPANAFYRRNGWDEIGERALDGLGVHVILFTKNRGEFQPGGGKT